MSQSPIIESVNCGNGCVVNAYGYGHETGTLPRRLKRTTTKSVLRGLGRKRSVHRTQSLGSSVEKEKARIATSLLPAMSSPDANSKHLEVEETRPRKSSGSSLQDMISRRFSSGDKKKKEQRKERTPSRGSGSAKKHGSTSAPAAAQPPPALTLDRIAPQTLREWEKSFDTLLRSPEGSQLFEQFLKSEFSEENIQFWRACESYRQLPESALTREAQSIFDEFISQEASKLVNIDHQTTKEIVESMRVPSKDTFSKAQHSIYLLMARDSYVRFIRSEPFKTALSAC